MYSLSDAKQQYPEIYEYYSQPHSRHILIWGEGGTRPDFLVKFLLQHPDACKFQDSNWHIDFKGSSGQGVPGVIHDFQISQTYDINAGFLVSKTHYGGKFCHLSEHANVDMIRIVYDNTDVDLLTKIVWEFTTKSSVHATGFYQQTHMPRTGNSVDYNNFKSQYFEFLQDIMLPEWYLRNYTYHSTVLEIDYKQVISPAGAETLLELLDLPVYPEHVEQYSKRLSLADSPDSIEAYGETWHRSEIQEIVKSFL